MLAALLMAGCATPQDKQAQADKDALCAVLDTNRDGKITKEEFMARTSDKAKGLEVFEKCDTEKKGYLTYDEVLVPTADVATGTHHLHAAACSGRPVERLTDRVRAEAL